MKKQFLLCCSLLVGGFAIARSATPEAKIRVELDRPILAAETQQSAFIRVLVEAPPLPKTNNKRTPVNLCMVLDRSSSMSGDRIVKAKEAIEQVVQHLSQQDIFSLVTYDSKAEVVIPAQHVENTAVILDRVRSIQPRGYTALFDGVSLGAKEIRKNSTSSDMISRMVLLSDGQANRGPSSPEELGALGASLVKEKIGVSTVGLGLGYNESLMLTLAQKSGANAYFAENSRDLEKIFTAELGDALATVVRGVSITVECPEGIKPLRVIGFDGTISGQTVSVAIEGINGGQSKYALVEVAVPPKDDGEKLNLADVKVGYELVEGSVKKETSITVAASFSKDETAVQSAIQKEVALQAVKGVSTQGQIALNALNRSGDYETVKKESVKMRSDIQNYTNVYGDALESDIRGIAQEFESGANTFSGALSPRAAKAISTNLYQEYNQQQAK